MRRARSTARWALAVRRALGLRGGADRWIEAGDASSTLERALGRVGGAGAVRTLASGDGKARASGGAGKRASAGKGTGRVEKAPAKARKTKAAAAAEPPSVGNRVLPHVSAQTFPLHESVVREAVAARARVSEEAAARAGSAAAPPPPTSTGNRVLPHVSAQKFPLDASITAAAAMSPPAEAVLRTPLSTPLGASTASTAGGAKAEGGASRSSVLAAIGIVGATILAMSMSGTDEEDLPPPPRRQKPKNEGAKRDVEVQIEIVKQPDVKELEKAAKSAPVRAPKIESAPAKEEKNEEEKELVDAFSATAEFLTSVEVRFESSRALILGPLLICRGFQYRAGPFTGQH